jgi:hypothetical protein
VEKRLGERRRGVGERRRGVGERRRGEGERRRLPPVLPLVYRRRTDNTKKKYKRTNNIFMCPGYRFCYFPRFSYGFWNYFDVWYSLF